MEVDSARDTVEVNVLDDVNKGFHRSVAVQVLKIGFVCLDKSLQSQCIQPDSVIHVATTI